MVLPVVAVSPPHGEPRPGGNENAQQIADYQVIRGGLVLDVAKRRTAPADILIKGDAIREVGPPGLAAPDGAVAMDAADKLLVFPLSAVFFASGAIILTLAGVASYIPQSLGRDRRKH